MPTPGHTRGHVVFLDSASSLMFSGDHVLPHIPPSIGVEPARHELPLRDYLNSLRLTRSYPDMRLLPAHGPVDGSSHTRVAELLQHHEKRLEQTAEVVRDGAGTAYDAALKLGWTRRNRKLLDLDLFSQVLAVGETNAHLDVLVTHAILTSSASEGVLEYAVLREV